MILNQKNLLYKVRLVIVFLLLGFVTTQAQTVKTVGATGADYTTLKGAFDAINAGTLTGSITLQVIANTTETTTAVLNATATGTANYSAVNIYPTVSGLTISGNIAGPMIKLNGASNVTIDGSVNGLGAATDLIISNTSTSTSTAVGTSTIQLYGDATFNTIKYSNIQGSANASSNNGIIMFLGVGTGTGNNNNTISYNNISSAGATRAGVAIYAYGVVGDLLTNNTIANNNIFNFISTTKNSYAIQLDQYTSAWTISNNSIYETSAFTPVSTYIYYMIYVNSIYAGSGSNFTITGNYIGGTTSNAGGSALTKSGSSNSFAGIYFSALNGGATSNIQGNTITNLNFTNINASNLYGIYIGSGSVNIGTTAGNTIGSGTGTSAIYYTGNFSTNFSAIQGISIGSGVNSTSPINIQNNIVGAITSSSTTGGPSITGIIHNCTNCVTNISNNIIGSTTSANSITASSTSSSVGSDVNGIYLGASSAGNLTVASNTIANLTNNYTSSTATGYVLNGIQVYAGNASITNNIVRDLTANNLNSTTGGTASVVGINLNGNSAVIYKVNNNRIYNLSNVNASFTGSVIGLSIQNTATSAQQFSNNFIYGLTVNAGSTGKLIGINSLSGNSSFANNIVSLKPDLNNTIFGIYDAAVTNGNSYYFNTIYIAGQASSGTNNTYAYYGNSGTYARTVSNNIFYNGRANTGSSTGKHYAAYLNYASSSVVNLSSNDYFAISASGGVMAGTSTNTSINQLPILANVDFAGFNIDPVFSIGTGLLATDYIPTANSLAGNVNGTGINTDYNGVTRNKVNSSIGAFDYSVLGNVVINATSGTASLTYSNLKSAFDAINAGLHQGEITIKLNGSTNESSSAILNASGTTGTTGTYTGTASYTSVIIYPTVSGVIVSGNLNAPLIDLNGADNVIIDGRVNATGSTKSLTIINTSTSNLATVSTIRWINDATYNTLQYSTIKGAAVGTTSNYNGVLFFAAAATIGNNNNTITNNDIRGVSETIRPNFLITAYSTTTGVFNKYNQITNNSIFDFFNLAPSSYNTIGIYLSNTNDYYTITGNSFYETTNLVTTGSGTLYMMNLSSPFTNLTVSNNFIGGSAANAQGTFTKSGGTNLFYGLYTYINNTTTSNSNILIQNNIVRNIDYTNSASADFYGMYLYYGNGYNISGNIIGAATGNDAIVFKNTNSGNTFYGMNISTGNGVSKAENNIVGAIKTDNVNQANATNLYGIYAAPLSSGVLNLSNNIVGSTTTANSIIANSQATGATGQIVAGIYLPYSGNSATTNVTRNTICKLTNNAQAGVVSKTDQLIGIYGGGRTILISANTIYDLSSATLNNTNGTSILNTSAVTGISEYCNICYSHDINKNTIYNLNATNAMFTGVVNGIKTVTPNPLGNIKINSNFIYDLKLNSNSLGANVYGINLISAYNTYTYNNIITIGEDIPATYYGIFVNETQNGYKYEFFNTVNLKGSPNSGAYNSYTYYSDNLGIYARHVKNNIFVNRRSNLSSASGKHYAAFYNYDLTGNSYLNQDNNDYFVTGTGGVLAGTYSGTLREVNQLPIFPTYYDISSFTVDPVFANASGSTPADFIPSSTSLAASNINSLSGNFINYPTYSTDFTGKNRNVMSTSMGAYEISGIAKITVNASAGTISKSYNTLRDAFGAINSGTHQGVINIYINGSTIETNSAFLNASGNQNALYSSINIVPKAPNLSITGNIANAPLIDFIGTKGVILDGRVNGAGTLTGTCLVISNTSTSTTAPTIRFGTDASNNIIRYNTIRGGGTANLASVILFYNYFGTKGILNNIIDHNNITGLNNNTRPYNAIYSLGLNATYPTVNITISNNNIYNFIHPEVTSNGIFVDSYNDNWNINGNSFFETTNFVPTSNGTYSAINIASIYGKNNHTISGNYIGGSAPNAGGSPWVKTNANDNIFQAISINSSNATQQGNIHSNTITNFDYSNSSNAAFYGIKISAGAFSVGTKGGNTIGASSGNNAIVYKAGANNGYFYGMHITTTDAIDVQNNNIGAIKTDNADPNLATHFYGIYRSAGSSNFINNTIGSSDASTSNSIDLTSLSTQNGQTAYGLYVLANVTGNSQATILSNTISKFRNQNNQSIAASGLVNGINLSAYSTSSAITAIVANNTVTDLSIANTNTSTTNNASVIGINNNSYQNGGVLTSQSFNNNTIYNLRNTADNFAGSIIGLYYAGSNSKSAANGNFIYGLSATGTNSVSATLYGTKIDKGAFRLTNNIISLGGTTKSNLVGLYIGTGTSMSTYVYFNTINISGSVSSGTNTSNAIYIADKTSLRDIRNNIFNNTRSTSGGSNLHYAYYMPSISGGNVFTSNYNNFIASGTGGTLGYYNTSNVTVTNITTVDANSVSVNPVFGADLTLKSSFVTSANLPAQILTDVITDFNDIPRSITNPLMGAIESNTVSNTVSVYNGSNLLASYINLKQAFDAINSGTHTGTIDVKITASHFLNSSAILNESGIRGANYVSVSIYPTVDGIKITGNIPMPLIYLNGADNVNIDGRVNKQGNTNSLEFNNQSLAADKGTTTIKIENDASNFTLQYCLLKGSSLSSMDGIFTIGNTTQTGNDQILIANNIFTNAYSDATKAPLNAIYVQSTIFGYESDHITIDNNLIYDNFNISSNGTSYAINIQTYNSYVTVSNNSIYKISNTLGTISNSLYGIYMSNTQASSILNNYIGGSAPQAGGSPFVIDGSLSLSLTGIYLIANGTVPNQIQGNVITNLDIKNSTLFTGIYLTGTGSANVGDSKPNTIGAVSGNNAILFKGTSTTNNIYGIQTYNTGASVIKNNIIGSITASTTNSLYSTNIYGISLNNYGNNTLKIINNTIGSTDGATTNSIASTSSATSYVQNVRGIYSVLTSYSAQIIGNTIAKLYNGGTGTLLHSVQGIGVSGSAIINDNTISDLTSASDLNTDATTNPVVAGILQSAPSAGYSSSIQGNKIYNLKNIGATTAAVNLNGIYFNGLNISSNNISGNYITNLIPNINSTATTLTGIKIVGGSSTYSNNIISLGGDVASNFVGIYESGALNNNNKIYFNTVNLTGSISTGTNTSTALYSAVNTNTKEFKNNILVNTRSTTGGSSLHFALYVASGTNTITSDYNNYFVSGTGSVLGYYGANVTNSAIVTGNDSHSISTNPGFTSGNSNPIFNFYPSNRLIGDPATGITVDNANRYRSTTIPTAGALELDVLYTTADVYVGNVLRGSYVTLNNAFDAINAGTHTGTLEVKITANNNLTTSAILFPSGTNNSNYSSIKIYPSVANAQIIGNIDGPLIDLNGADNVTIEGRLNANTNSTTSDLTIINQSVSSVADVSTIRFVNSAENNILTYLTIKGASTNTTGKSANIYFSSSVSGNGNDNNTIDRCNITGVSATLRPLTVISTSGGTATIFDNGNIISNNSIFDYYSNNLASSKGGVYLNGYSTNFKVLNNSFYETQVNIPTVANTYYGVYVYSTSNVYHTIQGNYFGGSSPQAGGNPFTVNPASNLSYIIYPIYINSLAATNPNSIQGNVIKNYFFDKGYSYTPFMGISVWAGLANIGTITGNIIGSSTGSGSITINDYYPTTGIPFLGIYVNSSYAVNVSNNTIGSITTNGVNIYGIYSGTSYGSINVSNNLIGSTDDATVNSLIVQNPTSPYAKSICGICLYNYGVKTINNNIVSKLINYGTTGSSNPILGIVGYNGTSNITNNTIRDLTNASNTSSYNGYSLSNGSYTSVESASALTGIYLYPSTTSSVNSISNNNLYNFYRPVTQASTSFTNGISFYSNSNNTINLNANFINNFVNSSTNTNGYIYGIYQYAGTGTINLTNNVISLGGDYPTRYMYAAYINSSDGNKLNAFYNTFNLYGKSSLTNSFDYSLYVGTGVGNLKNIQNNILVNTRTSASTNSTVYHYGLYLNDNIPQNSLTLSNNNYYVGAGTGRALAYNSYALNALPLLNGFDANSVSLNPNFSNPKGTSPYEFKTGALLNGVTVAATNVDYTAITRGAVPNMGAFDKLAIPQAIAFNALATKTYGDPSFMLTATGGNSGNPVTFTSADPSIATCTGTNGTIITILKAGTVSITANQLGNAAYAAATPVSQNLVINKANQTISLSPLPIGNVSLKDFSGTIPVIATASSGLSVTVSLSNTSAASLNANNELYNIGSSGSVSINLFQAGNMNYNPAVATYRFDVVKANQAITFNNIADRTYSGSPITISTSGLASSDAGLPITYSIQSGPATITSNSITITGAGVVKITASQAGDAQRNAAESVTQTLNILKGSQSINFSSLANKSYGDAPFIISATGGSGSSPVTFTSSDPSIVTCSGQNGSVVTILKAGTVSITASQLGDINYNDATPVVQNLVINKINQTLTLNPLPVNGMTLAEFGIPIQLSGTATSGLPIVFSLGNTTSAFINDESQLENVDRQGTIIITLTQDGDVNYNPATVSYSFDVTKSNQTIYFDPLSDIVYTDGLTVNLGATTTSALTVSYEVVSGPATVSNSTLTLTGPGQVVIRASQAGNNIYNPAGNVIQTLNVNPKNNQNLYFNSIPDQVIRSGTFTFTITSTAGESGNPVTYNSSDPSIATVSGTNTATVTVYKTGYVQITANQASNANYAAASMTQSFNVTKPVLRITANNITKNFGQTLSDNNSYTNFTVTGLTGSESIGAVSVSYINSGSANTLPDIYPGDIVISNATGGTFNPNNYDIVYVNGDVTVFDVTPTYLRYPTVSYSTGNLTTVTPSTDASLPYTSMSVSPALPAGLTLDATTGIISGTPVGTSSNTYTVTLNNVLGSITGTIFINVTSIPDAPIISYTNNTNIFTQGVAITDITPNITNPVSSLTISPALPNGLYFNTSTGVITGTATTTSSNSLYTITATNAGGSSTATISVQVVAPPPPAPAIYYADAFNIFNSGTAITAINPSITGTVTSWSISPNLPSGLNFNSSTGVISGTPSSISTSNFYTITATNAGGSGSTTIAIQVDAAIQSQSTPPAPIISYINNVNTFTVGTSISAISATVSGTVTSWSITPTLAAGLSFNTGTGAIAGTPSAIISNTIYTISATNSGGTGTATITIQVNAAVVTPTTPPPAPVISYTNNVNNFTVGTAINTISATVSGTVTSWSIAPTLSAGLTFNTSTGAIAGTPSSAISNTTYTISATNTGGTGTATITIQVNAAVQSPTTPPVVVPSAPVISYASKVNTFTVGSVISTISATVSGTVSSWAITPSLPAGLTFNTNTGAITGTPSVAISNTAYTISATNAGGAGTVTITIQVNAATNTPTVPIQPTIPYVAPITGTNLICGINGTSQLLNATNGGIWSSSKPNIATVSSTGLVKGISTSSDTLSIFYTVTVDGVSNTAILKLNYVANPIPGIKMSPIDLIQNESTLISARDIGVNYAWSSTANASEILSALNTRTPYAKISDQVVFTIKITTPNGCITTDTLELRVFKEKAIYLPNTFTPNGDGINDLFKLNPVGIDQLFTFSIYNSRGVKIFETNNIYEGWDGRVNGIMQPVSSYVWFIEVTDKSGKKIKEYGTITLLR